MKYCDEGLSAFNSSPKLGDIFKAAFKNPFKPALSDIVATDSAIKFAIIGGGANEMVK